MALKLDLHKAAQGLRLSLEKRGIVTPPQAELAFVLDVSGSFEDEHAAGITNDLLTRLVPWGMVFDPDQKLDCFTFSSGPGAAHYVGEITTENYQDYVAQKIIGRVPGWKGGTVYSDILEKILKHFGWMPEASPPESTSNGGVWEWFRGLFASETSCTLPTPSASRRKKSIGVFVTDGENEDKDRTQEVLAASQRRGDQTYFLFIGISNQGGDFPFLREIADRYSNTGLVIIRDLKEFVAKSDDELNQALIGEELVTWLKR